MEKIRTLIVDDEPLAREGIRVLLEPDPAFEVVGECGNGTTALQAIRERSPDLVFLDVQMPQMDGFEVLARLDPEHLPVVIFVTAYDQYALRAFEHHALDYLLKPFDDERFERTLTRVKTLRTSCRPLFSSGSWRTMNGAANSRRRGGTLWRGAAGKQRGFESTRLRAKRIGPRQNIGIDSTYRDGRTRSYRRSKEQMSKTFTAKLLKSGARLRRTMQYLYFAP